MFPADACISVDYEDRAAEWEARRKAAAQAAKAKEEAEKLNQVNKKLQHLQAINLQRPNMPTRAHSTGFFGAIYQSFNNQNNSSSAPNTPKPIPRSASSSPPPPSQRALKPSELPMPKATWAGPSEGEVCVVPAWS